MTTKNWHAIAQGQGLEIPAPDWDRIVPALDALELAFRPLVDRLPPELEPSYRFDAGESDK